MAPGTAKLGTRRGRSKNLTLDEEAAQALPALAAGHRTQGRVGSMLILAEVARREERARLKAAMLAALKPEDADEVST